MPLNAELIHNLTNDVSLANDRDKHKLLQFVSGTIESYLSTETNLYHLMLNIYNDIYAIIYNIVFIRAC